MAIKRLMTFDEAAKKTNVLVASLRKVSDDLGTTIRMGRSVRIDPDSLTEVIEKCRQPPKVRVSTRGPEKTAAGSGKSETKQNEYRPALRASERLKSCSQNTSKQNPANWSNFATRTKYRVGSNNLCGRAWRRHRRARTYWLRY